MCYYYTTIYTHREIFTIWWKRNLSLVEQPIQLLFSNLALSIIFLFFSCNSRFWSGAKSAKLFKGSEVKCAHAILHLGPARHNYRPLHHEIRPVCEILLWLWFNILNSLALKETARPLKEQTKQTRNLRCLNTVPQPKPENLLSENMPSLRARRWYRFIFHIAPGKHEKDFDVFRKGRKMLIEFNINYAVSWVLGSARKCD